MYPFDAISNFGYGAVTTAPSPATTGTTLKIGEAIAANFPDPATAGPYNVTVWPTGVQPIYSNSEILRITGKAAASGGEVQLTIDREEESTPARTIIVGDQIALTETILARNQIFNAIISGFYEDKLLAGQSFSKTSDVIFKTPGDKTTYYVAGRLIKFHNGSLAIVASSSYSDPDTSVTILTGGTVPDTPTNIYIGIGRQLYLDEDDMVSDSNIAAPTQQSVKAYSIGKPLIDAKGDLIVGTAADTPAKKAVGSNGQIIVADSNQTDGLLWVDLMDSMSRQAIINGNFDVALHRQTTKTNPASLTVADMVINKWRTYWALGGATFPTNIVHSRQALTPGDIPNAFYFYRIAPDGAGSSYGAGSEYLLLQRIEHGTRLLCGASKKVTISFYARSSIANKTIAIRPIQNYGTGGTPTSQEIISASSPITLTSSWVKYTVTFTTNTLAAKTFGTSDNDYLEIDFQIVAGTGITFVGSGNIDIAQVQLCAGDVALPFQPKSYNEELAACQRYYYLHASGASKNIGVGVYYSATQFQGSIKFPVSMRAAPSLDATSGTDYYDCERDSGTDNVNSFTIYRPTTESAMIYNNSEASGTSGHAGEMHTVSASAYLAFNAEL